MHTTLKLINSGPLLAEALDTSYRNLTYHLYRIPENNHYTEFCIPKKSGGERVIVAPRGARLLYQRYLLEILAQVYEPPASVHGFVKGRSIVSNANPHVGALWVLNIDLKDFFPSIHFGRIRGLLQSAAYGLDELPAKLIAHLSCYRKVLPQGSPCSPVIANMIARPLDVAFLKICRHANAYYTRYADDITISGRSFSGLRNFVSEFKGGIEHAKHNVLPSDDISLSDALLHIISDAGFALNPKKTRLAMRRAKKVVTGLLVNRKVNVSRTFVRTNRAMLHAWDRYNYYKASDMYKSKYAPPNAQVHERTLHRVLKGRIDYVGQIRGRNDAIYKQHHDKLYDLERRDFKDRYLCQTPKDVSRILRETVWVISVESLDENGLPEYSQGTAFYIGKNKFLTCDHIFWNAEKNAGEDSLPPIITMHREQMDHNAASAKVVKRNKPHDVALVSLVEGALDQLPRFELAVEKAPTFLGNPTLTVAGYPNHGEMDTLYVCEGKHLQIRKRDGITYHAISARITIGISGGPIVNADGRVVGIAIRGIPEINENSNAAQFLFNGFIEITTAINALSVDIDVGDSVDEENSRALRPST